MPVAIREVHDGITRLTVSAPREEVVSRVHCYLLEKSDRKYVLIDSGWASSSGDLIEAIGDELGDGITIERLVLTHLHPDHFGGAKAVIGSYSSKMSYHKKETLHWTYYNAFKKGSMDSKDFLGAPGDVLEGAGARFIASRALLPEPDSYLADGAAIGGRFGLWRVVHTPGHSPGHVCLYRPKDGTMLSGDHILPGETPNVAFYPVPGYNALHSYLASLAKVMKLSPRVALPAHGGVIGDVGARVKALSAHHLERLFEVLDGLGEGAHSVTEVASSVRWSRGSFGSLERFDKWLAILETASHLEFLVECGVVRRERGRGRSYRLTGRDRSHVEKAVAALVAP